MHPPRSRPNFLNRLEPLICLFLLAASLASFAHEDIYKGSLKSGSAALASSILNNHPYLLEPRLRESLKEQIVKAEDEMQTELTESLILQILETIDNPILIDLEEPDSSKQTSELTFDLPGDRGGILFKVSRGPGPESFKFASADLSRTEKFIPIPVASTGTTWSLLSLSRVPDGVTHLYASLTSETGVSTLVPLHVSAPQLGRLRLKVLSDDSGELTPAMVRLQWLLDGSDRAPDSSIDLTEQLDSQGSSRKDPVGGMITNLPGLGEGNYWIVAGPVDMMLPPGAWRVTIRRGIEHLIVKDDFHITSGKTTEKVYRPKRWVNMAARGWYSGDDHVHAQIQSESDAERLLTWAQAEDLHVLNILEMGDHERSYFQQRGFGESWRSHRADTVLVPGQEDPRIFNLGHTIALNISERVRDTSRYYLHDWVYDRVQEVGGLYGYAHVNRNLFNIRRDMSLNIPKGKVDFVELLQFHELGTDLYYDFLNLGAKITASAGSDVPWGGTVGEVRVYGYTGTHSLSPDGWFNALAKGRTFVTNGPMLEFTVDDSLPGDEISLDSDSREVTVKARAWGHQDRLVPTRLEIVQHGKVIQSASQSRNAELKLEFKLDPGQGCWVAARAYADNGSAAHTTPVYLKRPSLRFWHHAQVPTLIDRCLESLEEIESMARQNADPDSSRGDVKAGSLIGNWFGEADFTRPKGLDYFSNLRPTWPASNIRGSFWSVRWNGTLKLPDNLPDTMNLYLDSSGPSSVIINGEKVLFKNRPGEKHSQVQIEPGIAHEIEVSYSNRRSPRSYIHLSWSAPGHDKQPVPATWLAFRGEDYQTAIRHSASNDLQQIQLKQQTTALLERVESARVFYQDLRDQWKTEIIHRK